MQNKNKLVGVLALAMFVAVLMPNTASAGKGGFYSLDYIETTPAVVTCNPQSPEIYSISPSTAVVGSGAKIVTVNGACFTLNSVARFNGQNRVTSFINSNILKMEVTNADMSVTGSHLVSVVDLNNGLSSNAVFFTVTSGVAVKSTTATVATGKVTKGATLATVKTKPATALDESSEAGAVAGASDSNLSANALSSGVSFVPDTLLEWVFLFILILLGVKLWRSATVTEKEKNAPLKHA